MNDTTPTGRARTLSPTLLICTVAALITVVGLFLPSLSPVRADSEATTAEYQPTAGDGIEIIDFGYSGNLTVRPGQIVQVRNSDGAPHTVTATDGSFDSGVIDGGASGSFVAPNTEGTFTFVCTIHPSMSGVLTVSS